MIVKPITKEELEADASDLAARKKDMLIGVINNALIEDWMPNMIVEVAMPVALDSRTPYQTYTPPVEVRQELLEIYKNAGWDCEWIRVIVGGVFRIGFRLQ